jgi:RNA polymerase sigma factor (sigma-70 family)
MATNHTSKVFHVLRRAALLRDGAGLTDAQLLEEYLKRQEEAALAALVRRHGPMVWGVCRRILRNYHDAEDAFQATFLVLVRKAASIASAELLANWLYGVAHQTALKARATTAKRTMRERQVKEMPEPAVSDNELWNDLQPLLDRELSGLSDKYRVAIVLCDLEGKTRKEAARQLGVPEGTLAARLARGRKMLAARLARHGLALSAGSLAAVLAENAAQAAVPSLVLSSTIKAASLFAAGQAAAVAGISIQAAALVEGVLKTMFVTKLKIATSIVLGMGLLGIGWGTYSRCVAVPPEAMQEAAPQSPSAFAAPDKEGGRAAQEGQGEKKIRLPKDPPPVQALVSLTEDGKLVVKAEHLLVNTGPKAHPPLAGVAPAPMPGDPQLGPRVVIKRGIGGGIGAAVRPHGPFQLKCDLKEIQIFDTKGNEIEKKDLAKRLKEETLALISFGPVDPLHLRLLKEGTLVFILPLPPEDKMPLPDEGRVMYRKIEEVKFFVFFLRKEHSGIESKEQCCEPIDDIDW